MTITWHSIPAHSLRSAKILARRRGRQLFSIGDRGERWVMRVSDRFGACWTTMGYNRSGEGFVVIVRTADGYQVGWLPQGETLE